MADRKGPPPHPDNFQALGEPVPPERLAELGSPAAHGDRAPPATEAPPRGGERVRLSDRAGLERFYPRDEFERDAVRNADAKAGVLHGVSIRSELDPDGAFLIARATKTVSEDDRIGGSPFLAPFATADAAALVDTGHYGAPTQRTDPEANKERDYAAFIDRIIEVAASADFEASIGRDDDRLKGFHGG